jgi:pentatricopeptide repeat protein
MERLLEIMRQMRANGERPAGLITYNYMFSALLEAGQRSEAFSLLKEMEARSITPDIFTFEIFMKSLCDNRALAMTVEELFQLMKVRYKLEPSPACWEARLCAWLSPQQEGRVIQLLGEMREEGKARYCAALYGHLLVCAVRCGAWNVASHILALVVPRAPGVPADQFNVVLPAKLYEHLLTTRGSRMSVSGVPVLRTALAQLDRAHGSVGEGAYVHILYFASSIGSALADMAFHVLSKLSMMYSAQGVHALPRPYLEAYVECVNGQTDEKYLRHPYYLQAKLEPRHIELSRKIETLLKDHGIKQ